MYFMITFAFFACKNNGHTKWAPWPVHYQVAAMIESCERTIILKARQLGISWLVAGYALWLAIFHTSQNILLLSQGEAEAKKLLAKCKYIYQFLPEWMKPALTKDNESCLEFGGLHSGIYALPSTEKAGRSEGTNLIVCDEWAFHPYATDNWAALEPTLGSSAKFIGLSTANGRGNLYHGTWTAAKNLAGRFKALFLSWREAPGRDDAWHAEQKADYESKGLGHQFVQEYPQNDVEAFITSGHCLFEVEAIQRNLATCKPPIEVRLNGALKIWQKPVVGRRYVAGADVAEGKDAGNDRLDYSGVAIYDWQTCVHVADLHGQWPVDVFASYAKEMAAGYNNAYLGVERNNHGHAVLLVLKQLEYPNLYYHQDILADMKPGSKPKEELGWPTNAKTKPILEQDLAAAITSGSLVSYDESFWDECLSYVQHGNGTSGAQQGTHDDRVIKHSIALQMRKYMRSGKVPGFSLAARWAS